MARFVEGLEGRRLWCWVGHEPPPAQASAVPAAVAPAAQVVLDVAAPGAWETEPSLPAALGEVASGVINGRLYVVGETNAATFIYDLAARTWSTGATRTFPGNHHAAEVINDRLFLFGGLTAGSDGKVQVYDPATNAWSLGADMPWAAGSSSSALINGQVYVVGGIVGEHTTNRLARYDPAANTWTELAPMPQGRNHTAAGTDGSKFYVFGGRGPGSGDRNVTTNGFDTTQVYDPATNTWNSSLDAGSTLAPLPQARGGMGKAVYLHNKFFVIGGETLTGAGATEDGVYHRVDVYDPAANTWSRDADMPTARHGIFPVESGGKVYVAAGGMHFGGAQSAVLEVFTPAAPEPPPPPPPPPLPQPATVAGRWVFYNNSIYDGNDPAPDHRDDAAVATEKQALLPGFLASFANYTSYSRGINGVMLDVANLPEVAAPTAADFALTVGNSAEPWTWAPAPAPASVTVRRGAGVNLSARITLTWADNQIQKAWLRVAIAPGGTLNLAAADVFYFGNAIGETGNPPAGPRRPSDTRVTAVDVKLTRRARRFPVADLLNRFDFDRNGVVDAADRLIAKRNRTGTKRSPALSLIVGTG